MRQLIINAAECLLLVNIITKQSSCAGTVVRLVQNRQPHEINPLFSFALQFSVLWEGSLIYGGEKYGIEEINLLCDMSAPDINDDLKNIALIWEKIEWVLRGFIRDQSLFVSGYVTYQVI